MQLTISGQHVEISGTLRKYIQRKLTRIDRHFRPVIQNHMMLHLANNHHRVKTTAHIKGAQWHAAAENKKLCAAIDRVVGKLNRQATKHREKSSITIKKRVD
jgi:putative sigma-54 modulation protein